jgi:hypothetical protein
MAIADMFSRRQKKLKGTFADVFVYDSIPTPLRVQICHIWQDVFGPSHIDYVGDNPAYVELHKTFAREFSLFTFPAFVQDHKLALIDFFVNHATVEQAIDMIDVSMKFAITTHSNYRWKETFRAQTSPADAIDELNSRLLEHSVGYEFVIGTSPQFIRRDSEHLHKEAVIPALRLLHEQGFAGADEEYRKAHDHYRNGDYKECLNECLKAFESTMKTICTKKKWAFKPTDTASALIDACLKNGLLPSFMQAHLGTVKSALESAIPTVRNKVSGHGPRHSAHNRTSVLR